MRWTSICLAALLSTASLPAQVKLGESPSILFGSPLPSGCPIGIVAERRSPPAISTIGAHRSAPRTQGIQLRFHHLLAPKIQQVTVVVHGLSQNSRFMPVDARNTSDVEETFQLTRAEQAASLTASYVQPKRVFTTQWIELTSVDYTDGSTWHASRVAQCTVEPSRLVLVNE